MHVSMKSPTPPPGVGWGFAKWRVSKDPPPGSNVETTSSMCSRIKRYNYGKSPTPGDGEFGKRGLMPHPAPGGGVGHFIDTRITFMSKLGVTRCVVWSILLKWSRRQTDEKDRQVGKNSVLLNWLGLKLYFVLTKWDSRVLNSSLATLIAFSNVISDCKCSPPGCRSIRQSYRVDSWLLSFSKMINIS